MSGLLAGRVALVTGGARGIGAAIGRRFQAEGARVAVLDLPETLAAPVAFVGDHAAPCDLRDEEAIARAFADTVATLGPLDTVVANAGLVPPWRATIDLDLAEWDDVFAVNVRGVAATLKHAVPRFSARGGSIVLMASINSLVSHPRQMLYTASKHAVLGILRAAALDLGPRGIRVNAVAPGPIATEALLGRLETRAAAGGTPVAEVLAGFSAATPLGRMATAEDVAAAALYLASDLAAAVTGRVLPVDSGLVP